MYFTNSTEQNDFNYFTQEYLKSNNSYYGSIYDAQLLRNILCNEMIKRGYSIVCNKVEYNTLSMEERINFFLNRNFDKLIFTKPTDYAYQKEYRIFFTKENDDAEHIEEKRIILNKSLIANFES